MSTLSAKQNTTVRKRYKSSLALVEDTNDELEHRSTTATTTTTKIPFLLTDIGEGIHDVEIIQWYISPGDTVQQFDKVCEVQSDKATVDITSRYDGVIDSLGGDVGDMVQVGSPLLFVLQEHDDEKFGYDAVDSDGDGADADSFSDSVPVSSPVVAREEGGEEPEQHAELNPAPEETHPIREALTQTKQKVLATPAVRRLSMEFNLDLSCLEGTGKDGRILKSDVLKELKSHERENLLLPIYDGSNEESKPVHAEPLMDDEIIPIRGYNRIMVKAMETTLQVPHMVYTDEVEMSALKKCRHDLKSMAESKGVKISYLPFAIKACSLAMLEHPLLNSSIDAENMTITIHKRHDIGVAIDSPKGLVVPVIRNCQNLSVLDIAMELHRLRDLVCFFF
jgi:2-oxoisovalerate dehydrogenase E2 component (dihydrolipoyl transacylase)